MGAFILIILIISVLLASMTIINIDYDRKISFILGFIVVYIFSGFVTYTPDWAGYEETTTNIVQSDYFFNYIRDLVVSLGYEYREIHLIFTGIYTFLLIIFISRFYNNPFLIALIYVSIIFLYYATQIRFFLGYFSICLAFYYFYVQYNKTRFIIFLLFGFINHYSLLIFLIYFFFFKIEIKKLAKLVILIALTTFVIISLFHNVFDLLSSILFRFSDYFNYEKFSSFKGALYTFLPALLFFYLTEVYAKKKLLRFPQIKNDKMFIFLYRFSIIPYILIGFAFYIQIIGHRFIIPAVLFQLLLLFYLSKFNSKIQNTNLYITIFAFSIIYLFYIYFLPNIINLPGRTEIVIEMLNSNSILPRFTE